MSAHATPWHRPRAMPVLFDDDVHVWRAALDVPPPAALDGRTFLSAEERMRADRFHRPLDRQRFMASRTWLRILLSGYAGVPPADLCFRYGHAGKPALSGRTGDSVTFNIAHSEGLVLLAFARGLPIGVDLEWANPTVSCDDIAERFFSKQEVAELHALPPDDRAGTFFQ